MQNEANLEIRNDDGATALFQASRFGDIAIVRVLLEAGADVDARFLKTGATPIMTALLNGHTAVVKELLDNGANIQATSTDGTTLLHFAVFSGDVELVKVCK